MPSGAAVIVPVFSLPDVVLFPETSLPLHIFEPRYKKMLSDALSEEKIIGMQTAVSPEAGSPVFPGAHEVGCAGEIIDHEPLDDGRSNIVLRGLFRYRIRKELSGRVYRRAEVTPIPVVPLSEKGGKHPTRRDFRSLLQFSIERLAREVGRPEAAEFPEDMNDEALVNEIVTRLGLSTDERYRLLVMDSLEERYVWVATYLSGVQKRIDFLAPFRRKEHDARWN